jgi:hypothetical protein
MEDILNKLGDVMTLTEGEKLGITINEDDTADLRSKSGLCLIGRLLSERRVQKEAFHLMMSRLWKTLASVTFKEIHDNMWLLEFANESDKRRIKEGRPWLFDRSVLVLKEVDDCTPPLQMDFTKALFWVQVHDMPLTCMNKGVGFRIGESLGKVEEVDVTSEGIGWGRCLRIRIFLDLTKPLERGRALLINGKSVWISFKYEKLPQFCYSCGRIFHGKNNCRGSGGFRLNGEAVVKQWGAWMRADDFRFQKGNLSKGTSSGATTESEDSGKSGAAGDGSSVDKGKPRSGYISRNNQNDPIIPIFEASVAAVVHTPHHPVEVGLKESISQFPIEGGILRNTENVEKEVCSVEAFSEEIMEGYMQEDIGGFVSKHDSLTGPAAFVAASLSHDLHVCKGDVSLVDDTQGSSSPMENSTTQHNVQCSGRSEEQTSVPLSRTWKRRSRDSVLGTCVPAIRGKRKEVDITPFSLQEKDAGNKKGRKDESIIDPLAKAEAAEQPRLPQ